MKKSAINLILVTPLILCFTHGLSLSQPADSPWPMFRGSPLHTGLSPYDTSHITGTICWSYETGDGIESSPSIGQDGTIYVGSHDSVLYAINPGGSLSWSYQAGEPEYNEEWDTWKGICSSPAISSDGTIYITSFADWLWAFNSDASFKWSYYFSVTVDTWSSPTIGTDGTIYIGSGGHEGSGTGKFHAFNPGGTLEWSYQSGSDIYTTPAIGTDGIIYAGTGDHNIYAINPGGTQKWSYLTGKHLESSAAIGSEGTIYTASWDNNIYAMNPNGTLKWSYVTRGFAPYYGMCTSPAIGSDESIYMAANDRYLYALTSDGTKRWDFYIGGGVETTSSAAIGADGTIYVGVGSGGPSSTHFYAINSDGTEKWHSDIGSVVSSPAIGSDGSIYVGSWDHNLHCFADPTPNYINLEAIPTSVDPGEAVTLSYSCDFSRWDYMGVPVDIYLAAIKGPVVSDAPSTVQDALNGSTVYLFGPNMSSVYVFAGTVGDPTFSNVAFPPVPTSGSLNISAPSAPGFAGDYVFATAFIRRDTDGFVRTDGMPVENSDLFTIR